MPKDIEQPFRRTTEFIGDGVYVHFIEPTGVYKLMTGSHENPIDTIYLEPEVFEALIQFAKRMNPQKEEEA